MMMVYNSHIYIFFLYRREAVRGDSGRNREKPLKMSCRRIDIVGGCKMANGIKTAAASHRSNKIQGGVHFVFVWFSFYFVYYLYIRSCVYLRCMYSVFCNVVSCSGIESHDFAKSFSGLPQNSHNLFRPHTHTHTIISIYVLSPPSRALFPQLLEFILNSFGWL